MDHFAEMQITKQGHFERGRRMVLTPTVQPVEVQHLEENESRAIVAKLNIKQSANTQRIWEEVKSSARNLRNGSPRDLGLAVWRGVQRHCSVLYWLPAVNLKVLKADLIAGLTVGVMVIPQSMSYASIAGLPYVIGMYSSFTPTLVYSLLGNSRHLAVGPVALVSLLIEVGLRGRLTEEECPAYFDPEQNPLQLEQYALCPDAYAKLAFLTSMAAGLIQLAAGLLNLGFLVSFLGHPVVSGFTSAAAIVIGLSQLKDWLGYPIAKSQFVHVTLYSTFSRIRQTNGVNLGLGIAWYLMLVGMRWVAGKRPRLAFLRPLSPLITCVLGIVIMSTVPALHDEYNVQIVGDIPEGLPPYSGTIRLDKLTRVIAPATSAAVIGFMESIAIGKSLAAKHGYDLPPGQELIALGAANVIGSLFSSYPVTGSFSRSAVNNSTGAMSQLSGFVTSMVMLLTLAFLTFLFYYLPKFALAAIVISSVTSLVAWQDALHLWRVKREDCFLWVFAFVATLFLGVEQGILFSVIASLVIIIHESVRPQISVLWRLPGTEIYRNVKQENRGVFIKNVLILRIGASMYFANVAYIRDQILMHVTDYSKYNEVRYVIVEMTPVISIDSTAIHALEGLLKDLRLRKITLAFATLGNRVEKTMRNAALYEEIGSEWFHPRVHDAVVHCLQHELTVDGPMDFLLPEAGGPRPGRASGPGEDIEAVPLEAEERAAQGKEGPQPGIIGRFLGSGPGQQGRQGTSASSTNSAEEDERWYVAPEADLRDAPPADPQPAVRARYLSVVPASQPMPEPGQGGSRDAARGSRDGARGSRDGPHSPREE